MCIYIISMIDYLQLYNFRKLLETTFKSNFLPGYSGDQISSVPPKDYAKRIYNFFEKMIETENDKIEINEENEIFINNMD